MLPKIYAALFALALLFTTQRVQAQCTTSAGTINITNALVCEGSPFAIVANNDAVLDGNDIRRFVAFTGGTPNAGNALAVSTTGAFSWQPNFPVGSPFFVAAVAANDAGGGQLDWNDPCLSVSGVITVVYQAKPVVVVIGSGIIACQQTSTLLTVNATPPGVSYNWVGPTGDTTFTPTPSFFANQIGQYTVIVQGANGCQSTATKIVSSSMPLPTINTEHVSCNGASDGQFTITLSGGTAPYTYNLGNNGAVIASGSGASPLTIGNLTAGSYSLTVTDANGCSATRSVIITQPAPLTVFTGNALADCSGQANLNATAAGGTLPYSFLWSNGATTQASGLISGLVSVTATDANGCTAATPPVTIVAQAPLSATASNPVPSGCNTNNGTLALNTTGGTPPYAYKWSNTANTQNLQNLGAGTYFVTVTDERGCTVVARGVVLDGVSNMALDAVASPVSCNGGTNSSAMVTITGGSGNFSMNWSNGGASPTATNLVAGTYTVTVLDVPSGCTAQHGVIVKEPQPLTLNENIQSACNGSGSIDLSVLGGTPGYTYLWSNGASTSSINNLAAGLYSVTVTDARGCTAVKSMTVLQSSNLMITLSSTPAGCLANSGSITATISGGLLPYASLWSNGATTFTINNLSVGTYTVTVSDALGCTATATGTVIPTTGGILLSTAVTPAACNANTGAINLTAVGGPNLAYLWNNGSTTEDLSGLSAGTYGVTVTDLTSGCTATASATVTSNGNALNISTAVTPVSCFGLSNGAIDLNASGGTGPYTYLWSNGSTNQAIHNLSAGTYTVTVRDVNNCSTIATVTPTQPPALQASVFLFRPASCASCSDGGIECQVLGGTPAFSYLWSNGTTNKDLENVLAGDYNLTVTDQKGCTTTIDKARIPVSCGTSAMAFQPSSSPNESCGNVPNGAIVFNFLDWGDTLIYTYNWSNGTTNGSGSTITTDIVSSIYITGLTAGLYTVTVTSVGTKPPFEGCFVTEVEVKNGGSGSLGYGLTPYAATCGTALDGGFTVDIQPRFALPPYSYTWTGGGATGSGSNLLTEPFNIANLPAGQYSVTVTNGAGCSAQRTGSIGAQNVFFTSTATAAACTGNPNGQITLSVNGTLAPYTYQWSNGTTTGNGNFNGTTAVLSNLTAGTYNITVTNAAGCTAVGTRVVQQGNMAFSVSTVQAAACNGGTNGAFSVNVDNVAAVGPYAYTWSNGSTTGSNSNINAEPFTLSGLSAGTYQLTVTNGAGCTATSTFNLPTQFPPSIAISATSPACYGGTTGQLRLSISSNATAPYTYSWSNGTASGNGTAPGTPFFITNLAAGNYVVTVTNGNGCSNIATATLSQPNQPAVSFTKKEPSCFGQSNGSIVSTFFGANAPYAYKWLSSNGLTSTAPNLLNIPAGTYQLTVTNSLGCSYSPAPIILGQPAELTATAGSSGCGSASATVVAQGGTTPYTYVWSNGASTAILSNVAAGVYGVTVRDAKSCSAVDAVLVQPGGTTCSVIKGFVRQDLNSNCVSDGEPGLVGWYVMAQSATGTYFATTDATGEYRMRVPPGTYSLNAVAPAPVWELCPAGGPISVSQPLDTAMNADLLAKRKALCPALSVNIGTGFLRRCFDNYYTVEYCNNGTAPAENAYVVVKLDPFLIFKSASIPNQAIGGNQYRFAVGNLGIGECGNFLVKANLSCTSVLGQTHCTEAHIYPDTLCLPFLAQWSGASLEVDSRCAPDSLRFVLKNKGTGDMDQVAEYIIIEDHVMLRQMPFQLAAGDSMVISVPANGHSWRLEAPQAPFHPTLSRPILSVEGCKSTAGAFSTGFVSQFPVNDADPWIDIDCQVNVGAYDPNDKQGFPLGYGPKHYVRPGTELDYLIRFQNTGTDTAFNVVVLDTLSKWLDPCTVRPGASSHEYQFELYGPGILRFVFPNILLPDSTTNEAASHGYVKFRISPQADAPLETLVENKAAIYFDFNEPVITNTADHRLGINFVTTSLWQPNVPLAKVELSPNPFGTEALLRVKGLQQTTGLKLRIFGLGGQLVREMGSDQAAFTLKRGDLPEGMYLYRVEQDGKWVGSGKMVVQ